MASRVFARTPILGRSFRILGVIGCLALCGVERVEAGTNAITANLEQGETRDDRLFRDREWQFDLFGLGAFYQSAEGSFAGRVARTGGKARQFSGRPGWGFGAGASYFFQRFVGVGFEQDVFGRSDGGYRRGDFGYVRWASVGNLFVRWPLDTWHLAPYAMAGGGAFYGSIPNGTIKLGRGRTANYSLSGQGFVHVGGGLECRISRGMGVFSDLRCAFSRVEGLPDNQLLWRFGMRLAF